MARFTIQLFGVTVFALGLIWFVGNGQAVQTAQAEEPVLWADTVQFHQSGTEGSDKETVDPFVSRDTFLKDVKKLTQTAFNIRNQYMEEVDAKEIIKAGIEGMLSNLDRYSVLMEPQEYSALMEATHGKYEGLGMQIDSRDDRIVIITPIEGTPAYRRGLRAGDIIWTIDGEPTKGMTSADASKKMRGKAGTSIVIDIKRAGIDDLVEYEIERAIIELKSVNYYGKVPGTDIGYVRLSRFAEETSRELRAAINSLSTEGIDGLIFDLRSNGGGLLDQAKETSELFLEEGQEVVYTKGKSAHTERHLYSARPPIYGERKPLIILVDEGTASASEIVSGAIQDWDRGLIVGKRTYGKGLVQGIFHITADGSMPLKLTTAKYYVPSGRCIQKADKQGKKSSGSPHATSDEEDGDSLTVVDKEIFYTNGGRVVYGGGGIVPDVDVEVDYYKPIEINLERQSMFFDFAIEYLAENPNQTVDFEVTDEMVDKFKKFVKGKDFDYKTSLQIAVEKLNEEVEEEELDKEFKPVMKDLDELIVFEKEDDFEKSDDYIRRTIKREIVSAIAGERGVYEQVILRTDKTIKAAVEILENKDKYSQMLSEGQKKAEL